MLTKRYKWETHVLWKLQIWKCMLKQCRHMVNSKYDKHIHWETMTLQARGQHIIYETCDKLFLSNFQNGVPRRDHQSSWSPDRIQSSFVPWRAHASAWAWLLTAPGTVFLDNSRASSSLSMPGVCEWLRFPEYRTWRSHRTTSAWSHNDCPHPSRTQERHRRWAFLGSARAASSCVRHLAFSSNNFSLIA